MLALALPLLGGCDAFDNVPSEPAIGAVTVRSSIEGATLFVDALDRGPLRDEMEVQLTPGPHVLEARVRERVVARLSVEAQSARIFEVTLEGDAVAVTPDRAEQPRPEPTEPAPLPTLRAPGVVGALSIDAAREVLEAHRREVDACWDAAAEASDRPRPDHFELDLELQVAADGAVTRARASNDEGRLASCVLALARQWRWPPARGASAITVPLTFTEAHGLARPASVGAEPSQPTRAQVIAAMRALVDPVNACSDGTHGLVTARFSFRGDTGASDSVTTTCAMSRAVCDCVLEAIRGAHLPPFETESFSVTYPFRL